MKYTALSNSNIAIVKYWGKRDYDLNLPTNNSISFTMDDQLQTITTVELDPSLKHDELSLNGQQGTEKETNRVEKFLDILRKMVKTKAHARVYSKNSFPKSAGLASSASGFAALAAAGSKAFELDLSLKEISILARQGSGSASRSVFGGAVEWHAGKLKNGSDSYSEQLSPPDKWKDLRNVIAIISEEEKKISSVEGMKRIAHSKLFKQRLIDVGKRLQIVRSAVKNNDFQAMAYEIMQDSDNMHAVMADSEPPVVYLNNTSNEVRKKVMEFNQQNGFDCHYDPSVGWDTSSNPVAAYTFDAGPNAHVYTTAKYANQIEKILKETNGVKRVLICGIGQGIRFSNAHLF
ncbi:Diphosphomevalonate decarboxylase [Candidatus Bilamarchaeum dharawalense]|uniref:Diphosphomevalonate decarboxylase n=1 Tax=Candidatus Bilamarchaeum dharawalense TaxID=2885759 RepID=A0A5E4LMU8_9ARCH|nr:Diphosphomevalonate decarboxylase [Candidatus Bilamarchaeum dharawalense]